MSLGTARRADRVNRTILSILGFLLLVGGAVGLAYSLGAFGKDRTHDPVWSGQLDSFLHRHNWLWLAALALAVILAALCLRWLFFQLKPQPSVGDFRFSASKGRGESSLPASAVERAVVADLENEPGVRKAGARLRQHTDPLVVDAWVEYDTASYVPAFRHRVQDRIVSRLRQALEVDDATVTLELRPVSGVAPRVR